MTAVDETLTSPGTTAALAPEAAALAGFEPCLAGQSWEWDGVRFRFLHPPRFFPDLGNEGSCVLRIETVRGAALVPDFLAGVAGGSAGFGGISFGGSSVAELLARPMFSDPLRKHDAAPVTDGAAAIVLAAGDRARDVRDKPAWITGLAHVTDGLHLGTRDLTRSESAARAAAAAGGTGGLGDVQVAELHAPFSHQELILRRELGLGDGVQVNPSGGPLAGNPMFTGGAIRIGEAARRIWDGSADKVLATATSGPALQQNLVCVMEGQN